MVRLLVVADEVDRGLTAARLRDMKPNLVISCGDLDSEYLDFVATAANAPLFYVPGNHDPQLHVQPDPYDVAPPPPPPLPGTNLDGRIVKEQGLRIAGFGGSIRYSKGPHQYTQKEMRKRVRRLLRRERIRHFGASQPIDLLVAHSPPHGLGDGLDAAHVGFHAFHPLIKSLQPRLMVHGHIHPHGFVQPERHLGQTRIVNAIPHKLLELEGA